MVHRAIPREPRRVPPGPRLDNQSRARPRRHRRRRPGHSVLALTFPNGRVLRRLAAVDDGETVGCPQLTVFLGRRVGHAFFFGGPRTYRVSAAGDVEAVFELAREAKYGEYYATRIVPVAGDRALVVYKSGVMLVDDDLRVRWHRRKLLNDFFVAADSARVELVDHWDNRSYWSLATGADLPGGE